MRLNAVRTEVLRPQSGTNFFDWLTAALPPLEERDVLLVSSKVVAIGEGRVVPMADIEKAALVEREADQLIARDNFKTPITIKRHTLIGSAGIDESNGGGCYVLMPEDPSQSAARIHQHLTMQCGIEELGIIITDSRSLPMRYGATGVALGWFGLQPLVSHIGTPDLFNRPFRAERTNLVDGLAAAANLVMGETNECTPVVLAREVPHLTFVEGNTDAEIFAAAEHDYFKVLYRRD